MLTVKALADAPLLLANAVRSCDFSSVTYDMCDAGDSVAKNSKAVGHSSIFTNHGRTSFSHQKFQNLMHS